MRFFIAQQELDLMSPDYSRVDRLENRSSMAAVITAQFQKSTYHALRALTCEAMGGALILRGVLPSYYLRQVAQKVAFRAGATELRDQIVVQP
jgi:hypothetical protein